MRVAISPTLATVILIAITLIGAIAIAGFIFGLFGAFTNPPPSSSNFTSSVCAMNGSTIHGFFTYYNYGEQINVVCP